MSLITPYELWLSFILINHKFIPIYHSHCRILKQAPPKLLLGPLKTGKYDGWEKIIAKLQRNIKITRGTWKIIIIIKLQKKLIYQEKYNYTTRCSKYKEKNTLRVGSPLLVLLFCFAAAASCAFAALPTADCSNCSCLQTSS